MTPDRVMAFAFRPPRWQDRWRLRWWRAKYRANGVASRVLGLWLYVRFYAFWPVANPRLTRLAVYLGIAAWYWFGRRH